jgi:excisionase family DNA binding protein
VNLDDLAGRLTISVPEAGRALNIGRDAAYAAAARGEIPTLRLGRTLRVSVPKLLQLLGVTKDIDPAPPDTEERPGAETGATQSNRVGAFKLNTSVPQPTDSTQQARRRGGV